MVIWTLLAAAALLFPARIGGPFDGVPLDGRLEAIVIGLAVPALWWLDRGYLSRRFARSIVVLLLGWKALMLGGAVPHGLCATFSREALPGASPTAGAASTTRAVLRSWDVRANWRTGNPQCSAIVDRPFENRAAFPAWFVNLTDYEPEAQRALTLDLTGDLRARENGTFALQVGTGMHLEGTIDSVPLDTRTGRAEARLVPGVHHLTAHSSLSGDGWKLLPLWNGGNAFDSVQMTTASASSVDRVLWPVAPAVTALLVVLLVGGWTLSALSGYDRRVLVWCACAVLGAIVLSGSDRFDRLAGALLLGALWVPGRATGRRARTAFVLLGIPWLAFFAAHSFGQIGHVTAYSAGDWLLSQTTGYRFFTGGLWTSAGQASSALSGPHAVYGIASGALHLIFGDSSVGEVYADAAFVLVGALLCAQLVKTVAGFRWGIAAGALALATFTLGTTWYFVGRGLPDIAAAGCGFLAAFCLLRARLGRRSSAVAAGVLAFTMVCTSADALVFALCLPALLWPGRTASQAGAVGRAFGAVSRRAAAIYAVCIAAAIVVALPMWRAALSAASAGQLWHAVRAAVWMNEPPGFDARALAVCAGAVIGLLALLQLPKFQSLPFRVAAAGAGALFGFAVTYTASYPGHASMALMPFAVSMSAIGLAEVVPQRLRASEHRESARDRVARDSSMEPVPVAVAGSRQRVFATVSVALALVTAFLGLLVLDVYLHQKFERSGGFNIWGYRGPIVGRKRPGEYRVVMLGGSTAYGYGVQWNEAIPALLERRLRQSGDYTVVNLGYNNEGAYSFAFTLRDYERMKYDLACLYEGYNDMMGDVQGPNLSVFRHDSPVFRLTGYMPIFPIIFREKSAAMLSGDSGSGYLTSKTVFRPGLATKAAAEVLASAGEVSESLERQLGRVIATEAPRRIVNADASGCRYPWAEYCRSISNAVDYALGLNRSVIVITQPYGLGALRARHMDQQSEMAAMLHRRFAGDSRVRYVNLGDSVDLADPGLSFDRMHLTAAGNVPVAAALVEPVLEMAALQRAHPPSP
jgi:hypothetical protein